MKLSATSTLQIGAVSLSCWAGSWEEAEFFVLVEAMGATAQQDGQEVLRTIQAAYRQKKPQNLGEFKSLLKKIPHPETISYIAGLLVESMLYAVVVGNGQVSIVRGETKGAILNSAGSASGLVRPEDQVTFTTTASQSELRLQFKAAETVAAFKTITPTVKVRTQFAHVARRFTLPRHKIKPALAMIIILVTLLGVSIYFGVKTQAGKKQAGQIAGVMTLAEHQFEEGMALIDLNPIRARELLQSAKVSITQELAKTSEPKQKQLLSELEKKIDAGVSASLRKYTVSLTSFYDLSLIKPGGEAQSFSLYQDVLILLDTKNGSLYRLLLTSKAAKILAGSENLRQAITPAVHGEDIYILGTDISRVSLTDTSLPEVVPHDAEWSSITDFKIYGGNLYLLDAGKNWVWKYIRTETGFSSRQDYFVFDTLVDLSGAKSFAIDGTVWIAKPGKIMRFVQGKEDVWNISGLTDPLGTNVRLYTTETSKNLYVLDTENKRVVVFDKTGIYLAQFQWQETAEITDFVVSETLRKILLLSRGTIYAIELK